MTKNRDGRNHISTPIERHDTAAWASIEKTKPESNVAIPNELQVENAKLYVDKNQK